MRDKAIDEFESIFERASVPVLDFEPLKLARISAVLKGNPLDAAIRGLCGYLRDRFNATVRLHQPAGARIAPPTGEEAPAELFHSTAELLGQLSLADSQLVLIAEPADEAARVVDIDDLVRGAAPPVLIVRQPIANPADVFARILHSLTGNFQQTRNFSYSFALVERDGEILLLHVIDETEIGDICEALRISSEIDATAAEDLLDRLRRHGERYLRGVVAASQPFPYEVSYRLEVGPIVATVQAELASGQYGLLVVGHHQDGRSHISADDYQLMHLVRDVPILAL